MALEIGEIGIRMHVREPSDREGADEAFGEDRDDGCRNVRHEEIVDDCVRRVLKALAETRER